MWSSKAKKAYRRTAQHENASVSPIRCLPNVKGGFIAGK